MSWASLADNPYAPQPQSVSSSQSAVAGVPLPPIAPVQTFKFNFSSEDEPAAASSREDQNEEMGGDDQSQVILTTPASIGRPAIQHYLNELTSTPTVDEIEIMTLHASSTFTVQPLNAKTAASMIPSNVTSSTPVLQFYKRRSSGLGAHTSLTSVLNESDLKTQVYEGGFKVWECAVDVILFMQKQLALAAQGQANASLFPYGLANARVCELGCGHAFPALYTLAQGAAVVAMQDYNAEVIVAATLDNARMNLAPPNLTHNSASSASTTSTSTASDIQMEDAPTTTSSSSSAAVTVTLPGLPEAFASRCRFFSGDWSDPKLCAMMGPGQYDLILTSDTLYSSAYMRPLFDIMTQLLSPNGIALIAAKRYYFGIGGSTLEFCELVASRGQGQWECSCVETVEDGKSNIREILLLRRRK